MDEKVFIAFVLAFVAIGVDAVPRVFNISPRQGSTEGATVITINGEGFSPNQFSFGDGNADLGNRVFLRSGARSVECKVQVYSTNENQIVCQTAKASEGWYTIFVMVDGVSINKLGGSYCRNRHDCTFRYQTRWMPNIRSISPRTGPPGTLVTIDGDIYTDFYMNTQDIEDPDKELKLLRVYVGGAPCNLLNETTEQVYGLKRNLHKGNKQVSGKIVCRIEADYTDSVNASFIVSGNKGRSRILPSAFKLSAQNELYLFQIHPEIATITPESGSVEGGTLVTIDGKGFEHEKLQIAVGGVPCTVQTLAPNQITCRTAKQSQINTIGNRGLLLEIWPNTKPKSVDLISTFNASGAEYSTHVVRNAETPSFQWFQTPDGFSARLRGYFIPPSNNTYTFLLTADDRAVLYLSTDDDPANKVEITRLNNAEHMHTWFKAQSKPMELVAGKMYYIEGVMIEDFGGAHLRIGVRIHNTDLDSTSVSFALVTEQEIKFTSTYTNELQILTLTNVSQPFKLSWDGAETPELPASAEPSQVEEALTALLSAQCEKDTARAIFSRDYDTTKRGNEWGRRMNIYSYCGRQSLMLGYSGQTIIFHKSMVNNFNNQYGTYDLERYNTLCFAYTGELVKRIRVTIWWIEKGTKKDVLTERLYQQPFIGDSEWHYTCIDLMTFVSSDSWIEERRQPFSDIKVDKIALETSNDVPTFVDEVFIGQRKLSVTRVRGAVHPNGVYIDKIAVTKLDNRYNFTVSSLLCGTGLPLLGFMANNVTARAHGSDSASWQHAGSIAEIQRIDALAPPVGGNVVIGYGEMTASVKPDLSEAEMKAHLQSAFPGIGELTVKRSGDCSGHTYTISWPNDGGAKPTFTVVESNLTGVDANVTAYMKREGGLLLTPIPSDMLRSFHPEPQVTLTINGIPASCYGNNCTFRYSEDYTPVVKNVSPDLGSKGTTVTISGSSFSLAKEDNFVMIGGDACALTSAMEDEIVCTLGNSSAGAHKPIVNVSQKGTAKLESRSITIKPIVTSFAPLSGSSAGGTSVTITGSAFSKVVDENAVSIGGKSCLVTSSEFDRIICLTPKKEDGGDVSAQVQVTVNGQNETASSKFGYDSSNTAKVTDIDKSVLPVTGGVIAFTGTGFGDSQVCESPVRIGDTPCMITIYSDTTIHCELSALSPGKHAVKIQVANGYADASVCPTIDCKLEVTGVWPTRGSLAGGSLLTITGAGFNKNDKDNSVSFGDIPCDVESSSESIITCKTRTAFSTYKVTNMGMHPQLGKGYAWEPRLVNINAGDWVEWQWNALPGMDTIKYGIHQTTNRTSVDYDGAVFVSQRSVNGRFTHQFTQPGTYFFSAGNVNGRVDVQMTGVVTVKAAESVAKLLQVMVNNVSALHTMPSGATRPTSACSDVTPPRCASTSGTAGSLFQYTYTPCGTPMVTSLSHSNITTDTIITIQGIGFGTNICQNKVFIGGYMCEVKSSSATSLTCAVSASEEIPAGKPLHVDVEVLGLGKASFDQKLTLTLVPLVSEVSPKQGSLNGGTNVNLKGTGFTSDMIITLGDKEASCKVKTANYTSATCITTKGSEESAKLFLQLNGVAYDVNKQFAFTEAVTPKVLSISPNTLSASNTTVKITGEAFTNNVMDVTVSIGSTNCKVVSASDAEISCLAEGVIVGDHEVKVNIGNLGDASCRASSSCRVVVSPIITGVEPKLGSTNGGTALTITGVGFDQSSTTVLVGGQGCSIISVSTTTIVCVTPASKTRLKRSDGTESIKVQSSLKEYPLESYTYSPSSTPVVNSVTPSKGRPNSTVTIVGSGFSNVATKNKVKLGDSLCHVSSSTNERIDCIVGDHPGGVVSANVEVDDMGFATSTKHFEFELFVDNTSVTEAGFGGGGLITSYGTGFDAKNTNITICGEVCQITEATSTSITCIIPPMTGSDEKVCDVNVVLPTGASFKKTSGFRYQETLTARIASVTPSRGGTAGGTKITIVGKKFKNSGNIVEIGGTPCVIASETRDQIVCTTGEHGKTEKTRVVVDNGRGHAVSRGNARFHYVDVWSSPFTWGSKGLPQAKDFVIIPKGQSILLDMDTPVFKMLLIQGGEVIFDDKDVKLNSEYILITDGGLLQVGTEEKPFKHKAIITLHGHVRSKELPIYGAKVLGVRHGNLELHGRPVPVTWTKLADTVNPGDDTIRLMESVKHSWRAGDSIVMATTGHRNSQKENEELVIKKVHPDGKRVTLTSPVKYKHISTKQVLNGETFEARAEVGLLTRNIVVQGSVNDEWTEEIPECPRGFNPDEGAVQTCYQGRYGKEIGSDQFGSQVLIHGHKEKMAVAHIEYVEVRHAGQAFRLGRYPLHFHMNGDVTGNYIRGCGIHHTFNRAATIHGSHNLLLEKNVAYNNMGHAYFIEDGIETNNTIQFNLGIFTRTSSSLLNTDVTPATFWVTNPDNTLRHNAAAGGSHFGYWYNLPKHPDGMSTTTKVCPRNIPVAEFKGNTAHSFGVYGLWIFQHYDPRQGGGCDPKADHAPGVFSDFTVWHCERGAEVVDGGSVQFHNFLAVDNEKSGIETVVGRGPWDDNGPMIKDSVVIGWTDNSDNKASTCTEAGIITPQQSRLQLDGIKFINFDQDRCAALRHCSRCKPRQGGFPVRTKNLRFEDAPNKVAWKWEHEGWYEDLDGTLTGIRGGKVVPTTKILPSTRCVGKPEFSRGYAGSVCDAGITLHRMAFNNYKPESLEGKNLVLSNEYGSSKVPFKKKRLTHMMGWMATMMGDNMLNLHFENADHITNISYSGGFYEFKNEDYVIISHNFTQKPDSFSVRSGKTNQESKAILKYDSSETGNWHFDEETNTFTYMISGKGEPKKTTRNMNLKSYTCLYDNCGKAVDVAPVLGKRPDNSKIWSDPSSWSNVEPGWGGYIAEDEYDVPSDGDDVMIPKGDWIVADVQLPKMNKLYIYGTLELSDTIDHVLETTYIIIQGGRLIVGYPDAPFTHKARIVLRGHHRTPDINFPGVTVGSKAIGVFGGLDLHGIPTEVPWTRLAKTAEVGESSITLEDVVDWKENDEIVLTTTSFDAYQTETFKIEEIISEKVIRLNGSLKYRHLGDRHSIGGKNVNMAAEVGLLTRNVVVEGFEDDTMFQQHYGARVLIGSTGMNDGKRYKGFGRIKNVEFRHTGQDGFVDSYDPRFSLSFLDLGDISAEYPSYVRSCSFHNGFSTAIGAFGTNKLEITDNVVHHTVSHGIEVGGQGNSIVGNLVSLTMFPGTYNGRLEPENLNWIAGIMVSKASELLLMNNVVAGSEMFGYWTNGEPCNTDAATYEPWQDNTAHSCLHGIHMFKYNGHPGCSKLSNFNAYRNFDYGIFFQTKMSIEVAGCTLVENGVGLMPMGFSPESVTHQTADKYVSVTNTLVVGSTSSFDCSVDQIEPVIHGKPTKVKKNKSMRSVTGGKVGVLWPTFMSEANVAPFKPWDYQGSYPTIKGIMKLNGVTFANFGDVCGKNEIAIHTPVRNGDCMHPIEARGTKMIDVAENNRVFIHYPLLEFVTPKDCVDMDCDGKKKAIIRDMDGGISGVSGGMSTIIPQAEHEWGGDPRHGVGDYRIPKTMLSAVDGSRISVNDIVPNKGLYRPGCQRKDSWHAHVCQNIDHNMIAIESLDADTETRRVSPLALATEGYVDLINGPMDHGCCFGYTCQERISTFYGVVATAKNYDLHFTGTTPQKLRVHLLNTDNTKAFGLGILYSNPQRLDVYHKGKFVVPTNADTAVKNYKLIAGTKDEFMPKLTSQQSGTNWMDKEAQTLYILVRGPEFVEIKTTPIIQLSLELGGVTVEEFFEKNLVRNLADLLNISPDRIRVMEVVRESRRRRAIDGSSVKVKVEIGDPPAPGLSSNGTGNNTGVDGERLTSEQLNAAVSPLVDQFQLGTTKVGNMAIENMEVVPSIPAPVDRTNGVRATLSMEQATSGPLYEETEREERIAYDAAPFSVEKPEKLLIDKHPIDEEENAIFSEQPRLYVRDAAGDMLSHLGMPTVPWEISVKILSGPNGAVLIGKTTVKFRGGWANFTDLVISGSSGDNFVLEYVITRPSQAGKFKVLSEPFQVRSTTPWSLIVAIVASTLVAVLAGVLIGLVICKKKNAAANKVYDVSREMSQLNSAVLREKKEQPSKLALV